MRTVDANIEINRIGGKLSSISVVMPIWDKHSEDGFISVDIPLFGIKSIAINEEDATLAVNEAIHLFCFNSENFGEGLEKELHHIGWRFINKGKDKTTMSFRISNRDTVLDQIMQTGEQFVERLDLALAS